MLADLSVPKRVVLAGVVLATLGTLSNLLAVPFLKLTHSFDAFRAYAEGTSAVQTIGLFVALVGGIMFARSEPLNRVAWWALFVAIISFAFVELMTRNLMNRTAIVVPAFYGGEMTALSMLLISALRLIRT
ncbi:MAG: hypothetical protein ABSC10_14145 [Candidatus Acidiferrales bacterium]|jgi:hypothetical protein